MIQFLYGHAGGIQLVNTGWKKAHQLKETYEMAILKTEPWNARVETGAIMPQGLGVQKLCHES